MVDVTVLEVHLPDAQFDAPFARTGGDTESEPETAGDAIDAAGGSAGGSSGGAVAALLVLAGLAALAWYLRRGR